MWNWDWCSLPGTLSGSPRWFEPLTESDVGQPGDDNPNTDNLRDRADDRTQFRDAVVEGSRTQHDNVASMTSKTSPVAKPNGKPTPDALGRRLLAVLVYDRQCRVGVRLSREDLEATEIGDWKMPDFKAARGYAAAQGWVTVHDDGIVLTPAGLASA